MTVANWTIEHVAGVDVRINRHPGKSLLLLIRMASGGMVIWDDGYGTFFFIENPALLQEKAGAFLRLHGASTPMP